MKRVKGKAYYFHLTTARWTPTKLLTPRETFAVYEEPLIPRICVAPTVGGCISAIHGVLFLSRVQIFRTLEPVYAYYTFRVADSRITGERWLVEPTWFMKMYTVDLSPIERELRNIPCGSPETLPIQKKVLEDTIRPFLHSLGPWFRLRA